MFKTLDRGIEAACRSYFAAETIRAENKAEALAAEAAKFPRGTPEWREATKAFVAHVNASRDRGIELVK